MTETAVMPPLPSHHTLHDSNYHRRVLFSKFAPDLTIVKGLTNPYLWGSLAPVSSFFNERCTSCINAPTFCIAAVSL